MVENLQKLDLTGYKLLTKLDLWQAYNQILSIKVNTLTNDTEIFLKSFILLKKYKSTFVLKYKKCFWA